MKAIWNNTTIAEAEKDDLIYIEGNWYFPPSAIHQEYFTPTDHHTTCFWKGETSYYTVAVDGQTNVNAAWYYPALMDGSIQRVTKDFTGYVAFWRGVQVQ